MFAQVVVLGLAVAAPAGLGNLDAATQTKIRKLQIECRDELRECVRMRVLQLKAGQATLRDLMLDAEALLEAELEVATGAAERVKAHAAYLETARFVEKIAEVQFKAGLLPRVDTHRARAARLKAEVGWLKAGGKDTKKELDGKDKRD
jgi:hypothetical protein